MRLEPTRVLKNIELACMLEKLPSVAVMLLALPLPNLRVDTFRVEPDAEPNTKLLNARLDIELGIPARILDKTPELLISVLNTPEPRFKLLTFSVEKEPTNAVTLEAVIVEKTPTGARTVLVKSVKIDAVEAFILLALNELIVRVAVDVNGNMRSVYIVEATTLEPEIGPGPGPEPGGSPLMELTYSELIMTRDALIFS